MERVYIDRHGAAPKVFVKFTSQLSALRVSPLLVLACFGWLVADVSRLSMLWKAESLMEIPSPPFSLTPKDLSKASMRRVSLHDNTKY